ncbi:MAG: SDR family NAD(P)-dependent oxidoreductase, partial [Bdellovibrionales bacterium]|nr:SDR family NAD(P)-dependent oxidoreductase [Bdellovibrionales bacterium]
MSKIAVVTGANRGLGAQVSRELATRGYEVLLLGRDHKELERVAEEIRRKGGLARCFRVDVTSDEEVDAFAAALEKDFGRVDVLVNNAGVFPESRGEDRPGVLSSPPALVRESFDVNALGAFRLCHALVPLMKRRKSGCVVNVSSGMGQLLEMAWGRPEYRMSKAALNALTRTLADELLGSGVKVNSVCPGWVRTDMGGANADRSVEEGARGIVW